MLTRMKNGQMRAQNSPSGYQLMNFSVLRPRFWMVLLVLFFPFFAFCAHYFEALERTGTIGAILADTLFPATIIGYIVLLCTLKKRKI